MTFLERLEYNKIINSYPFPNEGLVDCPKANSPECTKVECPKVTKTRGKKTMRFLDMDEMDGSDDKLGYLSGRSYNVFSEKRHDLQKKYGLIDDTDPRTPKDLIDRLASGKFTVSQENMNRDHYSPICLFKWRDPNLKQDYEGFNKAEAALKALRTKAEDIIVVMSDDAARLKALQEFESATVN